MTDKFQELLKKAESGDPQSQFDVGARYYSGHGAPHDVSIAASWFRRAAEQGHAPSQFNLGRALQTGDGVAMDWNEAILWYRAAAEQGLAVAQHNLGILYERNGDLPTAASWYRKAADQNHAPSEASLGYALSQGRGVPANLLEAVTYYRRAAEQGFGQAQFNLAGMYLHGRGVAQDNVEAAKWYRRAASAGDPEAQNQLAVQLATGVGVPADRELAFVWFTLAAMRGNQSARANRDILQFDPDCDLARLVDVAERGDTDAQCTLATKLYKGDGVPQDQDAASLWLRSAAEGEHPWAQTTLAIQLRATKQASNEQESIDWLNKAAEHGDARARFNLGLSQVLGVGTPVELESGFANLIMASLAGFPEAREMIEKTRTVIQPHDWPSIFDRVKWSQIQIILGPLAEGHLDSIRESQENDDGSDNAPWLQYDREVAEAMFLSGEKGGSVLDLAFDEPVSVIDMSVGRAIIEGKPVSCITISLRNVIRKDGSPVVWRPAPESMEAVSSMIGMVGGRAWVRWNYLHF